MQNHRRKVIIGVSGCRVIGSMFIFIRISDRISFHVHAPVASGIFFIFLHAAQAVYIAFAALAMPGAYRLVRVLQRPMLVPQPCCLIGRSGILRESVRALTRHTLLLANAIVTTSECTVCCRWPPSRRQGAVTH